MNFRFCGLIIFVILMTCIIGCKKKDAKSELEQVAKGFEEPAATQTPQAASPPPTVSDATPSTSPPPAPAQQMKDALAAYKAGNLDDAVTRLQRLRATPALTPSQRMALQDAMAAVMTEIYSLAAKGDARAQQAIKQYNEMQTSRRTSGP